MKHEQARSEEKDKQVVIRLATKQDIHALAHLLHRVYAETNQKYQTHFSLVDKSLEEIQQGLLTDLQCGNLVWIAQKGQEVVGTVSLLTSPEDKQDTDPEYLQQSTVGEVAHFAIDKEYRKTGLGHSMLADVEQKAREKLLEGLALVTAVGTPLVVYYQEQLGFRDVLGTVPMSHHTGIVLAKKLHPLP